MNYYKQENSVQQSIQDLESLAYNLTCDLERMLKEESSLITQKEDHLLELLKNEDILFETKKNEIASLLLQIYRRNAIDILLQMAKYLQGKHQYIISTLNSNPKPWLSTVYSVCWASMHLNSKILSNYCSKILTLGISSLAEIDRSPIVQNNLKYFLSPKFPNEKDLEDFLAYYLKKVGGCDNNLLATSNLGDSNMNLVRNSMKVPNSPRKEINSAHSNIKNENDEEKKNLQEIPKESEKHLKTQLHSPPNHKEPEIETPMTSFIIKANQSLIDSFQIVESVQLKSQTQNSTMNSQIQFLGTMLKTSKRNTQEEQFNDFLPSKLSERKIEIENLIDLQETVSIYPQINIDVSQLTNVYEDEDIIIFRKEK